DERPVAAIAAVVDRAREKFLPGAGLALQEYGRTRTRDHRDSLEDLLERRALADQLALGPELADLLAECGVLAAQPAELERLVDHQLELLGAHRLREVIDRA